MNSLKELIENTFKTGEWWFTAIFIGVFVNLLSSYIWKKLEQKSIPRHNSKLLVKFLLLSLGIWFFSNLFGVVFGCTFWTVMGDPFYSNFRELKNSFLLTAYFLPFLMIALFFAFRIESLINRRKFLFISAYVLSLLVLCFMPGIGSISLALNFVIFSPEIWLLVGFHAVSFILTTTLSASVIDKLNPNFYEEDRIWE